MMARTVIPPPPSPSLPALMIVVSCLVGSSRSSMAASLRDRTRAQRMEFRRNLLWRERDPDGPATHLAQRRVRQRQDERGAAPGARLSGGVAARSGKDR